MRPNSACLFFLSPPHFFFFFAELVNDERTVTGEDGGVKGFLHGDIAVKNFILGDDGRLWLID